MPKLQVLGPSLLCLCVPTQHLHVVYINLGLVGLKLIVGKCHVFQLSYCFKLLFFYIKDSSN
jgi:hypothetical protein